MVAVVLVDVGLVGLRLSEFADLLR